jgi:hypothetical protein
MIFFITVPRCTGCRNVDNVNIRMSPSQGKAPWRAIHDAPGHGGNPFAFALFRRELSTSLLSLRAWAKLMIVRRALLCGLSRLFGWLRTISTPPHSRSFWFVRVQGTASLIPRFMLTFSDTWLKLFLAHGLFGALALTIFCVSCLRRSRCPKPVVIRLIYHYPFTGNSLLKAHC